MVKIMTVVFLTMQLWFLKSWIFILKCVRFLLKKLLQLPNIIAVTKHSGNPYGVWHLKSREKKMSSIADSSTLKQTKIICKKKSVANLIQDISRKLLKHMFKIFDFYSKKLQSLCKLCCPQSLFWLTARQFLIVLNRR